MRAYPMTAIFVTQTLLFHLEATGQPSRHTGVVTELTYSTVLLAIQPSTGIFKLDRGLGLYDFKTAHMPDGSLDVFFHSVLISPGL